MTKKEAIEFGAMWLQINEDCKDSTTYLFFKMAIKVLEQESILDKIRAEIEQIEINGHIRDVECFKAGIDVTLNVIDKYKMESEET